MNSMDNPTSRDDDVAAQGRRLAPLVLPKVDAGELPPRGECLVCGHIHFLAIWRDGTNIGVCDGCRAAAEHRRGSCSTERGCLCEAASSAAYDQENTCLEQPQASGMDSVSGSESRSLSPVLSSCSSRAASSAAQGREYEVEVVLIATAPSIQEARESLTRSGVVIGRMIGETTISDVILYGREDDE